MKRTIQISIAFATMAFMLLLFVHVAAQRDEALAEADELRHQLADQKVLVIEAAAAEPVEERTVMPTVEAMTRQDKIPTDADYVHADELLGMTSLGSFTVTHYCPCTVCCGKSDGITASGRSVVPYYSIAVDTSVIPLGTVVFLDYGDGVLHEARADDTGGAVKGYKIDLCVGDHQTAVQYGVRTATVYVGGRLAE